MFGLIAKSNAIGVFLASSRLMLIINRRRKWYVMRDYLFLCPATISILLENKYTFWGIIFQTFRSSSSYMLYGSRYKRYSSTFFFCVWANLPEYKGKAKVMQEHNKPAKMKKTFWIIRRLGLQAPVSFGYNTIRRRS